MSANEEASPICRGKNLSWETVMLFFNYMPKEPMPKDIFNSFVEENINSWTQTHSQIARQLAFYYEDNGICYPRFNTASTLSDLFNYMVHWAHNYFIPNPFAPSLKGKKPTSIYSHLIKCIEEGITDFETALDSIFDIPLSSHDKVRVYLQNYTNIKFDQGIISFNDSLIDNNLIQEPTVEASTNPKLYFLHFGKESSCIDKEIPEENDKLPIQQIFYGAPGTGKSKSVDDVCKKHVHIRTTFHPDSDYSTFVGCYKPIKVVDKEYNIEELHALFAKENSSFINRPEHRFAAKYNKSFAKLTIKEAEQVFEGISTASTISAETPKLMASVEEYSKQSGNNAITYDFIPQAFTNAYIKAWEDLSKPVFLVIEEINRGNCAQIFGDLFQLLDRKGNGYSSYEIEPNTDLGNYIKDQGLNIEGVKDSDGKDISVKLMAGELMTLPPNLHIWATMNTSDQSLFPIDSAFKRRWDWKYMPINPKAKSGWTIEVNGMSYSWSSFLEKINIEIEDTTSSEDKQLGFFFCKADGTDDNGNNGTLSAEKFVSKVLFYIYNDVFKDYGFEREFFKDKDNNSKLITFRSLFKINGDINEGQVAKILTNLGMEPLKDGDTSGEVPQEEDEDGNLMSSSASTKDYTKYSINGVGRYAKNNLAAECVEKYIELHPMESAEEVLNKWKALNMRVSHFIESKEEFDARTDNSKRSRAINCGDTVIYVATNGYGSNGMATVLKNAVNQKDWGITIEEA